MISDGRYWWKEIKPETFTLFCYREGAGAELARMTAIFLKWRYCRLQWDSPGRNDSGSG